MKRERELEDRMGEVIGHDSAVQLVISGYAAIRKASGSIGARVAARLNPEGNDQAAIHIAVRDAVDDALADIRSAMDALRSDGSWLEGSDADADQYDFG